MFGKRNHFLVEEVPAAVLDHPPPAIVQLFAQLSNHLW